MKNPLGNMANLMKQAQAMQAQMAKLQEEAATKTVTGTAGYRRATAEEDESSELEGSRDAAEKAAKKLPGALPR